MFNISSIFIKNNLKIIKKLFFVFCLTFLSFTFIFTNTTSATVGVSKKLAYQGRLTDTNGAPYTGTYYVCLSIYDASSAGTKLWPTGTPTNNAVVVTNGVFNVSLGDADNTLDTFDFSANDTTYLNVSVSSINNACGNASYEDLLPRQRMDSVATARLAYTLYGGDAQIGTGAGVASGQKLLKLDVKSVSDTVGASSCSPNGGMWYNSGNGRTLVCDNNLYQVVGSSITNQFFDVTGPATTIKTFTLPNFASTFLTSSSTVAVGDMYFAAGTGKELTKLADVAAGSYLRSGGVTTAPVWSTITLPNAVTTGDILFANASNAVSNLADVAIGSVLISGGVGAAPSWGNAPGTILNRQTLTSGTTYTPTAGTKNAIVELWGGGAAGGSCTAVAGCAAGGGGSGGYARYFLTSVTGTYTYAIGLGGTAAAGATGNVGGNTTFADGATTITAFGGAGGTTAAGTNAGKYTAGGAGGAISTNGHLNSAGSPGGYGSTGTSTVIVGSTGSGASTSLGGGGVGKVYTTAATAVGNAAVANTGSGGSGGGTGTATVAAGGAGAAGVIVITEYR